MLSSQEKIFQTCITVISNLTMLPGVVYSYHVGWFTEAILLFFAFITSVFYHGFELYSSYQPPIMNAISWHHADNIFAIAAICGVVFNIIQYPPRYVNLEMSKIIMLCFIVLMQLIYTWHMSVFIVPITITSVFVISILLITRRKPVVSKLWLWISIFLLIVSMLLFIKGLDDANDYLKLKHSFWHFFIGLTLFSVLKCLNPESILLERLKIQSFIKNFKEKKNGLSLSMNEYETLNAVSFVG